MFTKRQDLVRLAIIVILWYLGLTYLPQLVGTCLDGECSFSINELVLSVTMPLVFFALPIVLEMILHKKSLAIALSDIGVTRFSWTGILFAMIYLLPLLVFFPVFSLLANEPLATQPNWQWRFFSALLINGLVEETMMRGYVFRHLRGGHLFWRAAALSTAYFAGYHLPLIVTAGWLIGIIGVIVAIPIGFLTAYIYERGNNTIWGPALLHAVYNGLVFVFVLSSDVQPIASSLYLLVGIIVSSLMLVWAYRGMSNQICPGYKLGKSLRTTAMTQYFQIRVKGHLDLSWSDWFNGMTLIHAETGETILIGTLVDQSALHGVLNKLRDLGVQMISVNPVENLTGTTEENIAEPPSE